MKHAYFLVLPNLHVLDLAGPLQIVATVKELGIADVRVECIGPQSAVQAFQNVMLREVRPLPARLRPGDVLFVVGSKLDKALMTSQSWREAVAWLRDRVADAEQPPLVGGICTGTFLLAEAGLLDGRLCTTHHRFVQQMRHGFPAAHVLDNRVCVRDRNIWSSAGVASGIDLALHVIADAYGEGAAIQVARENAVHLRRFGSDPELSALLRYRAHGNQLVHTVQDAIVKDLSEGTPCEALAQALGLSSRHLARIFAAETGISMKRYQTELRMELAHRLLADSTLPLERIVERCGFRSVQGFRASWNKCEQTTPSAVRRRKTKSA